MWKFITRGIRDSIERRVCRTNVYSQPTADDCNGSEAKPSLDVKNSCLNTSCRYTSGFCGFFNYRGTKDKKSNPDWSAERTFSDIIGWSGILAIGWAIFQTPCIRKHIIEKKRDDDWSYRFLKCPRTQVSYLVKHALSLKPKHVLPVTNCVGNNGQFNDRRNELDDGQAYGPITIEEALDAARNEYTLTHKLVMGEFELRYGIKALEEKRYNEAMEHFLVGAKLSSPGSMFNVGLCHELGIGTRIDPVKAVRYYQNAADKGHAGAMYNLGVFYAQGRGGLSVDLREARELFTKAASLGETQAQNALKLEHDRNERNLNETNQNVPLGNSSSKSNDYGSYLDDETFDNTSHTSDMSLDNYNSLYDKNSFRNPTDAFLDFLGVSSGQVLIESAK